MAALGGKLTLGCYTLAMGLGDILGQQRPLLDRLFGEGSYSIKVQEPHFAQILTGWMELSLAYDPRDQFVASAIKPLKVPAGLSEEHTTDTLLRARDIEVASRRKSALDDQQVVDELTLVSPLVGLFKGEQESCEATWFARGYNAAYTDWASGQWS